MMEESDATKQEKDESVGEEEGKTEPADASSPLDGTNDIATGGAYYNDDDDDEGAAHASSPSSEEPVDLLPQPRRRRSRSTSSVASSRFPACIPTCRNFGRGSEKKKGRSVRYDDEEEEDFTSLSPFRFRDDGYEWPSMFEEADAMFEKSILLYPIEHVRSYAQDCESKGTLTPELELCLATPLKVGHVYDVLNNNAIMNDLEGYIEENFDPEEGDRDLLIITEAVEENAQQLKSGKENTSILESLGVDASSAFSDFQYGIFIDRQSKRVEVAFRGAVSSQDIHRTLEGELKQCPNPMFGQVKDQDEHMHVHTIFHDYLFMGAGYKLGATSIYQQILEVLIDIFQKEEFSTFKLYSTGYSTGGALSTVFSFMLASEPPSRIPLPVTCFSYGSPRIGDQSFRDAFQSLEQVGKLRCLRVTTKHDTVTRIPHVWGHLGRGRLYKHVGMHLTLNDDDDGIPLEVDFPKFDRNAFDEWRRSFKNHSFFWFGDELKYHHADLYRTRLMRCAELMKKMYLNNLYGNKDIIGNNKLMKDEEIQLLRAEVEELRDKVKKLEKFKA